MLMSMFFFFMLLDAHANDVAYLMMLMPAADDMPEDADNVMSLILMIFCRCSTFHDTRA